ncbi:Outer membrane protein [bacterium HR39]|nr:Outer membrane protein [bacterium HR39]
MDPWPHEYLDLVLFDRPAVESQIPNGPAFAQALRAGYLPLVPAERKEADFRDSLHFLQKAVAAAKGINVQPDMPQRYAGRIPDDRLGPLEQARARLLDAFERDARRLAPLAAARAQVAYDCWLENEAEADPVDAQACREAFETAMAEVDRALAAGIENVYIVFFAFDSAELTPAARQILAEVAEKMKAGEAVRLELAGHADRAGPARYNERLSQRRAEAVAKALGELGVPREAMTVRWYGETRPRVETPDDVPEPQNRRVEITLG